MATTLPPVRVQPPNWTKIVENKEAFVHTNATVKIAYTTTTTPPSADVTGFPLYQTDVLNTTPNSVVWVKPSFATDIVVTEV